MKGIDKRAASDAVENMMRITHGETPGNTSDEETSEQPLKKKSKREDESNDTDQTEDEAVVLISPQEKRNPNPLAKAVVRHVLGDPKLRKKYPGDKKFGECN